MGRGGAVTFEEDSMSPRFMIIVGVLAGVLGASLPAGAQTTWNSVTVSWTTPGDDSLTGTASQFDLRYSTSPINAANYASATRFLSTPAPAASGTHQSVVVTGLTPATTYYFAIKTGDDVPNWAILSNVVSKTTLAAPDTLRPFAVASLAVSSTTDSTATLGWTATGDDSLTGTATSYDVRFSTSPINATSFASATQVTGEPAPAVAGTAQSMVVRNLGRQVTYYFAMKVTDDSGNISAISNVPSATTPDTMAPGQIRDLAAGFLWLSWHFAADLEPHRIGARL